MIAFLKQQIKAIIKQLSFEVKKELSDRDEKSFLLQGALLSKQQSLMSSTEINDYEFSIFSQFGDDGIIQYLIKHIKIENDTFIEFGASNFSESNTRFLMMNNNWSGFIMDGSVKEIEEITKQGWFWRYDLTAKAAFIDKDNIKDLLRESGFSNLGLLHIDLDGNDYYILDAIDLKWLNPAILILEYNSVFGAERSISVPYDASFVRANAHYSLLYWGASLLALTFLANQKGYKLVGCNLAGNNAYFVRQDLLNEKIKEKEISEAFKSSKFRESRGEHGELSFLKGEDRLKIIAGLDVLNVVTNSIEQL